MLVIMTQPKVTQLNRELFGLESALDFKHFTEPKPGGRINIFVAARVFI